MNASAGFARFANKYGMEFNPEYAQPVGGNLSTEEYKRHRLAAHGMAAEAADAHFDVAQKHSDAIQSYSYYSKALNFRLIGKPIKAERDTPTPEQSEAVHKKLLTAVDEAPPVHADMNVYSGISKQHAADIIAKHKPGDTLTTKAWTSTSFNPEVAGKFAARGTEPGENNRVVLHIRIKKGQKGVLHCESASMHNNEKESLIKPGTKLRINKVYEPGDAKSDDWGEVQRRRIISAEIVD